MYNLIPQLMTHNYSAIKLLKKLIETPSVSGDESKTATIIEDQLKACCIQTHRHHHNIWSKNLHFDSAKPTILLNSHHDTVKPNKAYTNNPYEAKLLDGKIYGLGSNDAGGALVSLIAVFIEYYDQKNLPYNLILAATAEEENSGNKGIRSLLLELPVISFAVVGEPTEMQLAIAEKGLLVIDGYADGIAGHAAHSNTENAIYNALEDIDLIRNYTFPKESHSLGKVKMNVTQINAGTQHNAVPAVCHFVVDVRVNDCYSNQEIFDTIASNTKSKLVARSFNLNSSSIPVEHPIVHAGIKLGLKTYGSPTLSDQANLSCPSLKLGPGKSERSHSANEYIYMDEINEGINIYIELFNQILHL